jgi:uncharacterized protein with NAD-binding domain and iron-sulfur cluster
LSRRRFLRGAALGAAWAAGGSVVPLNSTAGSGPPKSLRRSRRQTVAVFGGGVAGLTAAHELAERGFDVTVYERRAWGGKARSVEVAGSATGGRRPLPGEHAYRAEFGCYQNVPDTMRRIPFRSNPNGVFDNMVECPLALFARADKHDLILPFSRIPEPQDYEPRRVLDLLVGLLIDMELPPAAVAHLANRLLVFMSSCDARRLGQWERTSWRDFIGADRFGDDYDRIFGQLWEFVQGTKAVETSAKYPAWFLEIWFLYGMLGRGTNGPPMRVLDLPTNEAWIDPWLTRLAELGVTLRLGYSVEGLELRGEEIAGAIVTGPSGPQTIVADWYVCALPVERARALWTPEILAAAPSLEAMSRFRVAWYNGIQFFLRERAEIVEGIFACADSPWVASGVTQAQFWPVDFASRYGDGTVRDKLSAVLSSWDSPGIVYGKPPRDCTVDELVRDFWEQIKRNVNNPGEAPRLTDQMLHSWQLDPGLVVRDDHVVANEDPLVVPAVGTEQYRPAPTTGIPNLLLCGDYLDGLWEVANMETACCNGRRVAAAIVEQARPNETPVGVFKPYRPPEWEPFKRIDEERWRLGEPNLFDVDPMGTDVRELLRRQGIA